MKKTIMILLIISLTILPFCFSVSDWIVSPQCIDINAYYVLNSSELNNTILALLNGSDVNYSSYSGSADYWDALDTPADINAGDITDDGTYRLDSWDNFTGIPHATPSNGDVTHFSYADEIYDWVIGLGYSTANGTVTSVATDDNYLIGGIITTTGTISLNESVLNNTIDARDSDTTYTADEDYIDLVGTQFGFNESKLETTYYTANTSAVVEGTINAGTLNDTTVYDGVTFNFTEVAGSPGLDLRINFTNITDFNAGVMRYKTSSLSGDYPLIQMWDYDNSEWEDYPAVAESIAFATIQQPVYDADSHLQGGIAQMRIYKSSNGNTNNHYYVDWIAISNGLGTPASEEVDPFSVHRDGNVQLTANWDAGSYTITGTRFISDIVTGTAPFGVSSTTVVDNLNANMVEGTDLGTLTDAKWCVYDLTNTEIDCDVEPVSDTTYSAGNGISLVGTTFSVAGNTGLTQDADGLSVTVDGIGDTQLEYNTGQPLTITSNPTFNNQTITDCIIFASGGMICSGT